MLYPSQIPNAPQLDCLGCKKSGKCCDFQPFIPNFTLGALLESGLEMSDFAGEHPLEPIGLVPSASFRKRHWVTPSGARGPEFHCQFFDATKGVCRIWDVRPGECRFYFCEGRQKIHSDLSEELFRTETHLAQRALYSWGFNRDEVHRQIDILNLEADSIACDMEKLESLYRFAWTWVAKTVQER